jgi:hypothetical protein
MECLVSFYLQEDPVMTVLRLLIFLVDVTLQPQIIRSMLSDILLLERIAAQSPRIALVARVLFLLQHPSSERSVSIYALLFIGLFSLSAMDLSLWFACLLLSARSIEIAEFTNHLQWPLMTLFFVGWSRLFDGYIMYLENSVASAHTMTILDSAVRNVTMITSLYSVFWQTSAASSVH